MELCNFDNHQVLNLSVGDLVVHRKLIEIYGEKENRQSLEDSIRLRGIITPLQVSCRTGQQVVVSGKCRLQIALNNGLKFVPVVIGNYQSDEEEIEAVFAFNLHRENKTHYQKLVDANYLESSLRPLAKENQQGGAYIARKSLLMTRLSQAESIDFKVSERIKIREIVSKNIKMSEGSYSKGKKVFKSILQLESESKLLMATALKEELNCSVAGAYRFLSYEHKDKVVEIIESGEVRTIAEALAMIASGFRNPRRKYEIGQLYLFRKSPHKDLNRMARITKISNEFVYFAFRNHKNDSLEIIGFRPENVQADLCSSSDSADRERVYKLLNDNNFNSVYPLQGALQDMLDAPTLTLKEERLLFLLETGQYQKLVADQEAYFEMLERENKGFRHAA